MRNAEVSGVHANARKQSLLAVVKLYLWVAWARRDHEEQRVYGESVWRRLVSQQEEEKVEDNIHET
jgi:hypothetical protein